MADKIGTSNPPRLTHIADFEIEVGEPIAIGETHQGLRRVVPILGGTIAGPRLTGTILPAGADYQLIRRDGYTTLDARYSARLSDGTMLYIVNTGVRFGPPDVIEKMTRGEAVDPASVYFRTTPRFETAAPAYQWLTRPMFLARGERHPASVRLVIFEIG